MKLGVIFAQAFWGAVCGGTAACLILAFDTFLTQPSHVATALGVSGVGFVLSSANGGSLGSVVLALMRERISRTGVLIAVAICASVRAIVGPLDFAADGCWKSVLAHISLEVITLGLLVSSMSWGRKVVAVAACHPLWCLIGLPATHVFRGPPAAVYAAAAASSAAMSVWWLYVLFPGVVFALAAASPFRDRVKP